jgi:hypothetical protein
MTGKRVWSPALSLLAASLVSLLSRGEAPQSGRLRSWDDYRTIMWIGDQARRRVEQTPRLLDRLREMGINTAMVYDGGDPQPWVANDFPYYVENLVNRGLCLKFNSKVTDWDEFVTDWGRSRDPASLVRDYSLDDPAWRTWAQQEVRSVVAKNRSHQPLAYDLRDELSVTVSANPFDYDYSPVTLEGFRAWLKTQYADLAALNRQWQTEFGSWDEIKPFTTDQIKNRMATGEALPRGRRGLGRALRHRQCARDLRILHARQADTHHRF